MKRNLKIIMVLLCILAMLVSQSAFAEDGDDETTESHGYITLGRYPQTEIVSQASDSGVSGKTWEKESDYIIDADLYATLCNLSEDQWDANGDATVDGNQYRRIKASDATTANTEETAYYSWVSTDTYHYFKYEPIQWRILEKSGNSALLMSEIALDDQMYNTNITGTLTWESSSIRKWLNGYGDSNSFISTAFTASERTRILITTVINEDNLKSDTEGGNDTSDRIFLLSETELYGDNVAAYGFSTDYNTNDSARQAQSSTYAKAMGVETNDSGYCTWWSRSPGSYPGLFVLVRETGSVYRGGQHANSKSRGVRPAMRIAIAGDEGPAGFIDAENPDEYLPEMSVTAEIGESITIGFGGLQSGAALAAASTDEGVVTAWVENSNICLRTVMGGTADILVTHYCDSTVYGIYTLHVCVNFPAHTDEKELSLIVGETLEWSDESGDYSESDPSGLLDTAVATVAITGEAIEGTPGSPASLETITEFAAGEYIIFSNGLYLTASGSTLGTSENPDDAAQWTVSGSESSATLVCNGYYFAHSTTGVSLSSSGRNGSWKFSSADGLYFSSGSPKNATIYYLNCSGGFTVSATNDDPSSLCSYVPAVPETPDGGITYIQLTGVGEGEAYLLIGNTLYHITVVDVSKLTTLTLPSALTEVTSESFAGTASEVIIVPASCNAIAEKAFADCDNLRYVFLPAALEGAIPEDAFDGCGEDLRIIFTDDQ